MAQQYRCLAVNPDKELRTIAYSIQALCHTGVTREFNRVSHSPSSRAKESKQWPSQKRVLPTDHMLAFSNLKINMSMKSINPVQSSHLDIHPIEHLQSPISNLLYHHRIHQTTKSHHIQPLIKTKQTSSCPPATTAAPTLAAIQAPSASTVHPQVHILATQPARATMISIRTSGPRTLFLKSRKAPAAPASPAMAAMPLLPLLVVLHHRIPPPLAAAALLTPAVVATPTPGARAQARAPRRPLPRRRIPPPPARVLARHRRTTKPPTTLHSCASPRKELHLRIEARPPPVAPFGLRRQATQHPYPGRLTRAVARRALTRPPRHRMRARSARMSGGW